MQQLSDTVENQRQQIDDKETLREVQIQQLSDTVENQRQRIKQLEDHATLARKVVILDEGQ